LNKGYLPEALINFVALLGYNPKGDQEIYSYQELVELFDLSKVNPSGAVFDVDKLNWMNGHYIKQKSVAELVGLCQPFLERAGKTVDSTLLERIVTVEQERMSRLDQIVEMVDLYIQAPEYQDPQILVWKKADAKDSGINIGNIIELLKQDLDLSSVELVEKAIKEYIKDKGLQNGNVLWPTRVALSGQTASPSPFELIWALGKEESLKRLNKALQALS
jgi:glutamyl/glutaminyl-tRNA synthetase